MQISVAASPADIPLPPSKLLLALELRALAEFAAFGLTYPLLRHLTPHGDGHSALVLPGLSMGDRSTVPMRALLRKCGIRAEGWGLGLNRGPRPGTLEAMTDRIKALADLSGRKVSLVGWSLGGIYARQLSRLLPDHVRGVVTLASPFNGSPLATNVWRIYERHSGERIDQPRAYPGGPLSDPLPVPSTAIFSRSDGICSWRICVEKAGHRAESIEIRGSHCGMGFNPAALFAVADRLAQPENEWRAFDPSGLRRLFFRALG
ncbi:MAG: alpha/beta hydrolase [Methylobacterium mesophilicum]|nr:alpha/beta hydrolase [Methylobacterium mesophilicum]